MRIQQSVCLGVMGVFLMVLPTSVWAQDLQALEAFWTKGLSDIEAAYSATLASRPLAYEEALTKLRDRVRSAGELEHTLTVKAEVARFEVDRKVTTRDLVSEPESLKTLQQTWIRLGVDDRVDRAQRVMRLSKQYVEALDKLQKKLTVNNQLEGAVAVKDVKDKVLGLEVVKRASFILADSGSVEAPTHVRRTTQGPPSAVRPVASVGVAKGLVAHFRFEGGEAGLLLDSASRSRARGKGVVSVSGRVGQGAARFDGGSSALLVSDDSLSKAFPAQSAGKGTDFSALAWIRLDSEGKRQPIIGKQGNKQRGFMFSVETNNRLAIEVFSEPNTKTTIHSSAELKKGVWYHVATTYRLKRHGTSVTTLYLDGKQVGLNEGSVGPIMGNSMGLTVGRYDWSSGYQVSFDGLIDDARVYTRELSAAEVKQLSVLK